MKPALAFAATLLALSPATLFAQAPANNAETQLRDALRTATLQLRTAQGDLAAAQAAKDQAAAEAQDLAKRIESLEKKAASDRAEAQARATELEKRLAAKNAEASRLADRLKTTADALDQTRAESADREAKRASLDITRIELERETSALRRQNLELYRLGDEILVRYENYALGKALLAREPFTKLTRVKLQTLVQDYADALEDQRVKLPATAVSTETVAPAAP